MAELWRKGGKIKVNKEIEDAFDFNASIKFDKRLYKEDIEGSVAHAVMLGECGIITKKEAESIKSELVKISNDIESGKLEVDLSEEDIHTFIENKLTEKLGDTGRKLHTGRSRNDQSITDLKLYVKKKTEEIKASVRTLMRTLLNKAEENIDAIMPGYTHLQRAQPVTLAQHLMAYFAMFGRDYDRLSNLYLRMDESPLGAAALAGTGYPINRQTTAKLLGFDGVTKNSMDSVSDRDFCIEFISAASVIMMHLSRFSEEIILWSSWEFKFIKLDSVYSTGSSIMPQKRNPDIAELVRGKTGRVYGNLMRILTVMKGLPLAYNKDMQEDKEAVFDTVDTLESCLSVFTPMVKTMKINAENMLNACKNGYLNATDCADYLTKKGVPFRTAYKISAQLVSLCIKKECALDDLPLAIYKKHSENFEDDIFEEIKMENCVKRRISEGGTGSVEAQISAGRLKIRVMSIRKYLAKKKKSP